MGSFYPIKVSQPSLSLAGITAPGTSFGATILVSPGYGVDQLCASYQSKWFIWAGFA